MTTPQNSSIMSIIITPPAPHMNIIGCVLQCHSHVRSCAYAEAGAISNMNATPLRIEDTNMDSYFVD